MISKEAKKEIKKAKKVDNMKKQGKYYEKQNGLWVNKSDDEKLTKVGINCLPCIYTVHHLNPYKMGVFKN